MSHFILFYTPYLLRLIGHRVYPNNRGAMRKGYSFYSLFIAHLTGAQSVIWLWTLCVYTIECVETIHQQNVTFDVSLFDAVERTQTSCVIQIGLCAMWGHIMTVCSRFGFYSALLHREQSSNGQLGAEQIAGNILDEGDAEFAKTVHNRFGHIHAAEVIAERHSGISLRIDIVSLPQNLWITVVRANDCLNQGCYFVCWFVLIKPWRFGNSIIFSLAIINLICFFFFAFLHLMWSCSFVTLHKIGLISKGISRMLMMRWFFTKQ